MRAESSSSTNAPTNVPTSEDARETLEDIIRRTSWEDLSNSHEIPREIHLSIRQQIKKQQFDYSMLPREEQKRKEDRRRAEHQWVKNRLAQQYKASPREGASTARWQVRWPTRWWRGHEAEEVAILRWDDIEQDLICSRHLPALPESIIKISEPEKDGMTFKNVWGQLHESDRPRPLKLRRLSCPSGNAVVQNANLIAFLKMQGVGHLLVRFLGVQGICKLGTTHRVGKLFHGFEIDSFHLLATRIPKELSHEWSSELRIPDKYKKAESATDSDRLLAYHLGELDNCICNYGFRINHLVVNCQNCKLKKHRLERGCYHNIWLDMLGSSVDHLDLLFCDDLQILTLFSGYNKCWHRRPPQDSFLFEDKNSFLFVENSSSSSSCSSEDSHSSSSPSSASSSDESYTYFRPCQIIKDFVDLQYFYQNIKVVDQPSHHHGIGLLWCFDPQKHRGKYHQGQDRVAFWKDCLHYEARGRMDRPTTISRIRVTSGATFAVNERPPRGEGPEDFLGCNLLVNFNNLQTVTLIGGITSWFSLSTLGLPRNSLQVLQLHHTSIHSLSDLADEWYTFEQLEHLDVWSSILPPLFFVDGFQDFAKLKKLRFCSLRPVRPSSIETLQQKGGIPCPELIFNKGVQVSQDAHGRDTWEEQQEKNIIPLFDRY